MVHYSARLLHCYGDTRNIRSNVGLVVEHPSSSSCSAQIQSTWHALHSVTKCLKSDQKLPLNVL